MDVNLLVPEQAESLETTEAVPSILVVRVHLSETCWAGHSDIELQVDALTFRG